MSAATWPDLKTYVTPKRARVIRFDIDTEKQLRAQDEAWLAQQTAPSTRVEKPDTPPRAALPCRICGALPARRYMNGPLCSLHAPVVPVPDPARTAGALLHASNRFVA